MGTYVYTLRKAHKKNVQVDGKEGQTLICMKYAYKPFASLYPGDYGYAAIRRMEGRFAAQAEAAQNHWFDTFGRDAVFYIVVNDGNNGDHVYRTRPGFLPASWLDSGEISGTEFIGRLWKVGRKWIVQKDCPGHNWINDGMSRIGSPLVGFQQVRLGDMTNMLPAETCTRCGDMRYADPEMRRVAAEKYGPGAVHA